VSAGHGVLASAWAAIEEQRAAGATEGTVEVGDAAVSWRLARIRNRQSATVPASAVEAFRAVLGDAPIAGDGDLSRSALADRLGVSAGHGVLASAWAAIEEQRAAGATEGTVEVGDAAVPWRLMRVGPGTSPTVPASALEAFRAVLGDAPIAGDGDLSRKALADRLRVGAGHGVLASAWAAIEEQRAAGATEGTVEVGDAAVPWRLMRVGPGTSPTVPASALEAFRAVLGDAPIAGDGDLSRKALADRLRVGAGHGVLASAWAAIEEQRAAGAMEGTVEVGDAAVPWRLMRVGPGTSPTVPALAAEAFRAVLGDAPIAGDGDLSRSALADRLRVSVGHGVIVAAWAAIGEQRAAGATEGTVEVGDAAVPWRLMRPRSGRVGPFVPASAVETFRAMLDGVSAPEPQRSADDEDDPSPDMGM
ncbi:hypothetical protein, partial [Amorphus sp. 3PC139-8]|uniref:hypothetical protein n=1 Tax=Amorphus sp. 3PC139-8 TaxID=2735676 RepID=UPI00345C6F15